MSDSGKVETKSRVARWRIENLPASSSRTSDPFEMGWWRWILSVENKRRTTIRLFPENAFEKGTPIASFVIRVISYASERRQILHPDILDRPLRSTEDFVWVIPGEPLLSSEFILDVEFTDLKVTHHEVGESDSGWVDHCVDCAADDEARDALYRMLRKGVATDVTINAKDGTVSAHQAILIARSPVFRGMFSHDSKEKELATVDIIDMSVSTCDAFLGYLYGDIDLDDFLSHRLPLLQVADKYDVSDLRRICEESLTEDVDKNNVLERLQAAHLYKLSKLKGTCMRYLVDCGRIYDLHGELTSFFRSADRDLVFEVCQKVLTSSAKGTKGGFSWV